MSVTVKSLDERIDGIEDRLNTLVNDFADFRARVDTHLSLMKWIGGTIVLFAAGALFQVISVSSQAGEIKKAVTNLEVVVQRDNATLTEQGKAVAAMTEQIKALTAASMKHDAAIAALTEAVRKNETAIATLTEQSRANAEQIRAINATLAEQNRLIQQIARDVAELKAKGKP